MSKLVTDPDVAAIDRQAIRITNTAWRDLLGISASVACAIHCAAMPFVIGFLPMLGLTFLADESFHRWMTGICFALAIAAFVPGWRKHHRLFPACIGAAGLCTIALTAFGGIDTCCASCQVDLATDKIGVTAPVEHECTESCCQHANVNSPLTTERNSTKPSHGSIATSPASTPESFLIAAVGTWMTPLGGLLLVVGHLLNHRFGCDCDCCSTDLSLPSQSDQ